MLKQLLLGSVAVLALAACGGTDPTTGYNSRDQLHCYRSPTPNSDVNPHAICLNSAQLPISGGCIPDVTTVTNGTDHVALVEDGAAGWDGSGGLAGWGCMWVANGQSGVTDGTPVVLANASAEICCADHP